MTIDLSDRYASGAVNTAVAISSSGQRFTVGAEVIVLPPAAGFAWPDPPANNFIDKLVFDRLQKLRIVPSGLCDDETFLRRVTLDIAARTPTAEE